MLKTDDIKKAMRYKLGVAFGFISTLAITPCLGFAFREIPLTPSAYTAGLTLTAAVPQTLGIGISLVRSCGGNEGLALMLTGASGRGGRVGGQGKAVHSGPQRGTAEHRWHCSKRVCNGHFPGQFATVLAGCGERWWFEQGSKACCLLRSARLLTPSPLRIPPPCCSGASASHACAAPATAPASACMHDIEWLRTNPPPPWRSGHQHHWHLHHATLAQGPLFRHGCDGASQDLYCQQWWRGCRTCLSATLRESCVVLRRPLRVLAQAPAFACLPRHGAAPPLLPCPPPFRPPACLPAHPTHADFDLSIDMVALLVNLLLSVFVPSVIGKVGG